MQDPAKLHDNAVVNTDTAPDLNELVYQYYVARNRVAAAQTMLAKADAKLTEGLILAGCRKLYSAAHHITVSYVTKRTLKVTNERELVAAIKEKGLPVPYKKPAIDNAVVKTMVGTDAEPWPGTEWSVTDYLMVTAGND